MVHVYFLSGRDVFVSTLRVACVAFPFEANKISHSGRTKNGVRAKRWKEGGGGGERRERFPAKPSILKNAHWFSRLSSFTD